MFVGKLLGLCLFAVSCVGSRAYDPDEVTFLPGMTFRPRYKQWSGYLQTRPGRFLHYWFVTSQRDPAADPLVLWLNGGPGCSSLDGFLSENGPFHVKADGATLQENPFSWNRVANVLYVESPAGVGYSYSDDKNYTTNDDQVAEDNYKALLSFFAKFPNFTQNEFFIFGESYGGIYAPTLSLRVLAGSAKIKFKGFAVGNGISSFALNDQSLVYFAYYHGLFGEELWRGLNENCCDKGVCNFYSSSSETCRTLVNVAFSIVYNSGLNEYALYLDCEGGQPYHKGYKMTMSHLFKTYRKNTHTHEFPAEAGSSMSLSKVPPCINSTAQSAWLNQGSVRKALHIPDVLPPWDICSEDVGQHYSTLYSSMKDTYLKLLSAGLRALVYNGDTDMACNFLGDQWFVEDLGLAVCPLFKVSFPLVRRNRFTFQRERWFSGDHGVPGLEVRAPGWRFLSTVWKPHFPDSEGCGSHGSSVGSGSSLSPFPGLPEQRVLLSASGGHLNSSLQSVLSGTLRLWWKAIRENDRILAVNRNLF